jgi:hypothetical protein
MIILSLTSKMILPDVLSNSIWSTYTAVMNVGLTTFEESNKTWPNIQVRTTHLNSIDEFKSGFNKGDKTWSTFQLEETELYYNDLSSRLEESSKTWPSLKLEPIDLRCNDKIKPQF